MDDQLQMEMEEFLPLRDVVFNTLRKAILTGKLKPGERLMEVHLAGGQQDAHPGGYQETGTGRTGDHDSKAGGRGSQNHRKKFKGCAGGKAGA